MVRAALDGTAFTAAGQIEAAGGQALIEAAATAQSRPESSRREVVIQWTCGAEGLADGVKRSVTVDGLVVGSQHVRLIER